MRFHDGDLRAVLVLKYGCEKYEHHDGHRVQCTTAVILIKFSSKHQLYRECS